MILAVAGGVFAQELKVSGYLNSGLQGTSESVDPDIPGVDKMETFDFKAYAQDADVDTVRADVNIDFTYDNIGAHVKLRAQGGGDGYYGLKGDSSGAGLVFFPEYAYVNATVFNIVDIYGGKVDNGAWATAGDEADDVGEGLGALVQVRPIEGLNLGLGVYDNDKNTLTSSIFTFGAAYAYPDLFKIVASAKLDGDAGKDGLALTTLFAGAEVYAIPKLSIAVEIFSKTLGGKDVGYPDAGFTIDEVVSYDLGDLDVGATLWQFINLPNFGPLEDAAKQWIGSNWTEASKEFNLGIKANLWASYALAGGTFVPKLEVYGGYGGASDVIFGGTYGDGTVFYIGGKPSVTWNVGEGAKIVAAYDLGWGKASLKNNDPTALAQKVYVDFVWSF